jgi:hypothetical protein
MFGEDRRPHESDAHLCRLAAPAERWMGVAGARPGLAELPGIVICAAKGDGEPEASGRVLVPPDRPVNTITSLLPIPWDRRSRAGPRLCAPGLAMEDRDITDHIELLVREEHELLERAERAPLTDDEHHRLKAVTVKLDQYYDLLRQRRALRDAHLDPSRAHERTVEIVEDYLQ